MSVLDSLFAPLAQDPAYHAFADDRLLLGVPNFWNVVSNAPFFMVGAWGLAFLAKRPNAAKGLLRPWIAFFAGVLMTTFGSGYYHLDPDDASLAWDRLAMVVAFMGLFALVIGEYLSGEWANRLLVPLLLVGASSIWYWLSTEARGAGDLRPYAIVQFLPMLAMVCLVLLRRGRTDLGPYLGLMLAFYAAAKVFEYYDAAVFAAGGIMSGHAIKHLLAALAAASLLAVLYRRAHV